MSERSGRGASEGCDDDDDARVTLTAPLGTPIMAGKGGEGE